MVECKGGRAGCTGTADRWYPVGEGKGTLLCKPCHDHYGGFVVLPLDLPLFMETAGPDSERSALDFTKSMKYAADIERAIAGVSA